MTRLGHHVGDALLCNAARRLTKLVDKSGTFARLGGDEFAILLPAPCDLGRRTTRGADTQRSIGKPLRVRGTVT